jgi:SNF2 family DNA or RNA helicase
MGGFSVKTLYPFQAQAVDIITQLPGFILADECGLGKTVTAIEACRQSLLHDKILIIAPPALLAQWQSEIEDQNAGVPITVVNRLPIDFRNLTGYFLMGVYDLSSDKVRATLYSTVFDIVIIDEAHRIKNRKTLTAKWVKKISAVRRICLTGSPMEKNPADLWSLLNFIAPDDFPAYWNFVLKYLNVEAGYFEKYMVGGPKDPEAFGALLQEYMLRRTKTEVMPQLPEKIVIEQKVDMTPAQQEMYDDIKKQKDIIVELKSGGQLLIPNALALLTRLQQISIWPGLIDNSSSSCESGKLNWLATFLEDHAGEPAVIFTRFRDVATRVHALYGGDIVIGGRREISEHPTLCTGTIDAMGEGLNFQWAKHAIFLDSHWSTIKMTQAIDRIHRINITEPKNLYFLWSTREDKLVIDAFNDKMSEAELVYYFMKGLE